MKAVIVRQFAPFDQAEYGDLEDPTPGAGEIVVDIEAADVNFPDILYIEGKYQNKPPLPFSPGLSGAGRIFAVGAGVESFAIGQKVIVLRYHGTYAEKVAAPAGFCFPMPEAMRRWAWSTKPRTSLLSIADSFEKATRC
jgi:NADPH2:quinone reductase